MEIASYKRCSRPLCSSQTTTPYHTPHTLTCVPGAARKPETNKTHTPHPPPERGTGPGHGPVASGPNSVPNTKPPVTLPAPVQDHTPKGVNPYWVPGKNRRPLFVDIPPVSTRRRTYVCATGVLLTTPPHPHTWGKVIVGAP